MANKAISELPQAQNVNNQDLFVLEQSGIAKKLTAETFITEQGIIDALAEALDGHGGIQSVTLASVSGRIRTYRITFTDQSATTFQVYDGTSIDRISRTSSSGLDDVYTIFLSDGTTTFFTVHNGADGTVSEAMLNDALKDKAPAITETTESSAIANFTDGADDMPVTSLVAEIEPVQDLNGYDNPWPSGGGKNKIDGQDVTVPASTDNQYVVTDSTVTLAAGTYTLSFTVGANVTATRNRPLYLTGSTYTYAQTDYKTQGRQSWTFTLSAETTLQFRWWGHTLSANCTISDFMLEIGSSASSFAPYSNICPITGHTEVNVTRTGKNLLPPQLAQGTSSTVILGQSDATSFGTFLKAGTYTISVQSSKSFAFYYRAENGTENVHIGSYNVTSATFTLTENLRIRLYAYLSAGLSVSDISNLQLELGSTATTYEPYIAPATASLSWQSEAGTVYGGTIDVATGLLTVDRAITSFNGSETWYKDNYIYATGYAGITALQGACSHFPYATSNIYASNGVGISSWAFIVGSGLATNYTLDEWKSFLQTQANNGTPVTVAYGIRTPQTYQLTPQEVKTLLGTNNVWADTGNVSVTYPADTKMFIEKLTMPTEDDLVANQAITSGKYFMIGNSLYLALANIASGAQITIGTNAQRVSLADALNTINA